MRVREEGKEQGGPQAAGISKPELLGQGRSWCHLRGLRQPLLTFVCRAGQCEPNCPSLGLPWAAASPPCPPPFLLLLLSLVSHKSCPTLRSPLDCSPPSSSVLRISPGENAGARCHFLLQGIFLTQGSNPRLLHILYS